MLGRQKGVVLNNISGSSKSRDVLVAQIKVTIGMVGSGQGHQERKLLEGVARSNLGHHERKLMEATMKDVVYTLKKTSS